MSNLVTENILGERHMVDIIIYLHAFGSRSRTEIYRAISTSPHMARKIDLLEEHGIITAHTSQGTKKRLLQLTPLGKTYAESLSFLESQSGGSVDQYKSETIKDVLSKMERLE